MSSASPLHPNPTGAPSSTSLNAEAIPFVSKLGALSGVQGMRGERPLAGNADPLELLRQLGLGSETSSTQNAPTSSFATHQASTALQQAAPAWGAHELPGTEKTTQNSNHLHFFDSSVCVSLILGVDNFYLRSYT